MLKKTKTNALDLVLVCGDRHIGLDEVYLRNSNLSTDRYFETGQFIVDLHTKFSSFSKLIIT